MVVLEHAGQRCADSRLAQAYHIADQDAVALVQVVGGDLHRMGLEPHQLAFEDFGDAELADPLPRLARQVIGQFEVDVVGRHCLFARPTLLDD